MIRAKIQIALNFAAIMHKDQTRKKTDIPYIVHPAECMQILTELECSEDEIIAGILHDVVEDAGVTYSEIEKLFGKTVSDIVRDVSEQDKNLDWKTRKELYFEHIKDCGIESHYVCFADKLSNLRSIFLDYVKLGENVWSKFNAGKEQQKWFYTTVYEILQNTEIAKSDLFDEYKELLTTVFCDNLTK